MTRRDMQTTMANITANHEGSIHRILVALNSCVNEQEILEVAALLAQQLEAELSGLFVEDANLLHLAELPFAREIIGTHLQQRLFDMAQLQRRLRAEAERVRDALMRRAEQRRVTWSFLRTQGQMVAETVAATESMDLLVVGRDCRSAIVGSAPAETVGRIVRQSRCSVLIAARWPDQSYKNVTIMATGSSTAPHALRSGVAMARMERLPLRFMLITADSDMSAKLKAECEISASEFEYGISFESWPDSKVAMKKLAHAEPALLVLPYDTLNSDESAFKQMFESVDGPILIVR